jgi:hypothetical protein
VLQGFEGLLSTKEALRKRQSRGYKTEDMLFSLSSKSSPLVSSCTCWWERRTALSQLVGLLADSGG